MEHCCCQETLVQFVASFIYIARFYKLGGILYYYIYHIEKQSNLTLLVQNNASSPDMRQYKIYSSLGTEPLNLFIASEWEVL